MTPRILNAKVMHKRLFPRENAFVYGIYYLAFPLRAAGALADGWRFGVNRAALSSMNNRDHGARDGTPLEPWARAIMAEHAPAVDGDIVMVTMPRVLGHVFNPVSFWLCHDAAGALRAVICEVNNTFGERHAYLCMHDDTRAIDGQDWLWAEKLFHVSPFLPRDGAYRFRFDIRDDKLGIWIDYYDARGEKQLLTSLTGTFVPYTRQNLRRAFWRHPLVCLIAVARIHMQALRLVLKGIKYIPKPPQLATRASRSRNMTKL